MEAKGRIQSIDLLNLDEGLACAMQPSPDGKRFYCHVFPDELQEIRQRRRVAGDQRVLPDESSKTGPSTEHDLIGLAFSGGGIRSASFSLGVAQYLIEQGLFKKVDYLSTVSGGGYTGSCLSALMARRCDGERLLVDRGGAGEPPALNHLRNASNFLLPGGILNSLRMPSLFIVGVLQTLLLLLPIVFLLVFLTEVFFELTGLLSLPLPRYSLAILGVAPLVAITFFRPLLQSRRRNWEQRDRSDRRAGVCLLLAVSSLLAMPILAGLDFLVDSDEAIVLRSIRQWLNHHIELGIGSWLLWLLLAISTVLIVGLVRIRTTTLLWTIGCLAPALALGVYLISCVYVINSPDVDAVSGANYSSSLRDYITSGNSSRLQAAVDRILEEKRFQPTNYRIDFDSVNKSNWEQTKLKLYRQPDSRDSWWHRFPYLTWLTTRHQDELTIRFNRLRNGFLFIPELSIIRLHTEWIVYLLAALLWLFNYLFVNVNRTSLHPFYRDRLSRTFLIREGKSGIESADSVRLSELGGENSNAPYHLINTALNLQGSGDPQLRQRKTVPFLFSKGFIGSDYTGYCLTQQMEDVDRNMDLGTAMSISAAAAGPMMGARTLRSLTFLLAMLNVRLAYWVPHPGRVESSSWLDWLIHRNPGLRSLLAEASATVNDRGRFVNCSDGGHIENLGVYELLRRRCRTIICVDGSGDPEFGFFDLTTLQRYANIDLGAKVDIDVAPLLPDDNGVSKQHFSIGRITYHGGERATLIYIKLSYSGDEAEYLRFYRRMVPDFPHESTSDQFFNETKFEVYRELGYHAAASAFSDAIVQGCFESGWSNDLTGGGFDIGKYGSPEEVHDL